MSASVNGSAGGEPDGPGAAIEGEGAEPPPPGDVGEPGSRAVSKVPLPGTVATLSGLMVSTGAAALFVLSVEAASPEEVATRFPEQPVIIAPKSKQVNAAVKTGRIAFSDIAHLFLWSIAIPPLQTDSRGKKAGDL